MRVPGACFPTACYLWWPQRCFDWKADCHTNAQALANCWMLRMLLVHIFFRIFSIKTSSLVKVRKELFNFTAKLLKWPIFPLCVEHWRPYLFLFMESEVTHAPTAVVSPSASVKLSVDCRCSVETEGKIEMPGNWYPRLSIQRVLCCRTQVKWKGSSSESCMQILTGCGFGSQGTRRYRECFLSCSIKCHISVLIFYVMWLLSDDQLDYLRSEKREWYYSAAENRKKVLPWQGRAQTRWLQSTGYLWSLFQYTHLPDSQSELLRWRCFIYNQ